MPTPYNIRAWKYNGLIHNDYKALYDEYIQTTHCNHCKKEFKNSRDRCMDHDHETGLFRAIVCRGCNVQDRYIKYPTGYDRKKKVKEYREANKEYLSKKKKEYYEANKEDLLKYYKEYREANKEDLSKKDKEYYEANKESILKQCKEYRESKKEYLSNYFKEYREANRERISKRKKETYTCGCGSVISNGSKANHNKSVKHTTWEKQISP